MTGATSARSVRDATFELMRANGMTRIFGNPGSTEIPFLTDLPDGFDYVLGLHEGVVVGMAGGYALATGRPAFVNLHTAAGLGNAVNAIGCARDNRIPLVVVVGQQDRRQLGLAPFLTGRGLERLAGEHPVWACLPSDPSEVPGAILRAWHEARLRRGPALVVVPMGDWETRLDSSWAGPAAPTRLVHGTSGETPGLDDLVEMLADARNPAIVVGAGTDSADGWEAVEQLAERLSCPVWQDTFAYRAGFPQAHPLFAGHLPWPRGAIRATLRGHDVVLCLGTPAFRLYLYEPGPVVDPGTRVAVVTDDEEEAVRSRCDLAVLASPAGVCRALTARVRARQTPVVPMARPDPPPPPGPDGELQAGHVLAALAERLPADALLVEEAPSNRPELFARFAARSPFGFLAVANGALGFGLAAAVGLRMGLAERPVVALLGDGSSLYSIQGLWTAATYGVGTLFVVISNGGYAVMDGLARDNGGRGPWPELSGLDIAGIAEGMGCTAVRVESHPQLIAELDDALPGLASRNQPLLLDVRVS